MGFFSRKDGATPRKPATRPRPSVSSEAQAAELRVRARRRLAGAVALVLAAVVLLPMLLDSEPVPVSDGVAIRIPDRNSPFQPALSDPQAEATTAAASGSVQTPAGAAATATTPPEPPALAVAPVAAAPVPAPVAKPDAKAKTDAAKAEAKADAKKASASNPVARSDDGARALAMLEGRPTMSATPPTPVPAASKPQEKGNFVVQALSLDTATDAQSQRDKLSAAGVGNAFVDGPVNVNGKQKFRVRVGPFPSREAAQAAQTRLRTLGFGGAFITAQ